MPETPAFGGPRPDTPKDRSVLWVSCSLDYSDTSECSPDYTPERFDAVECSFGRREWRFDAVECAFEVVECTSDGIDAVERVATCCVEAFVRVAPYAARRRPSPRQGIHTRTRHGRARRGVGRAFCGVCRDRQGFCPAADDGPRRGNYSLARVVHRFRACFPSPAPSPSTTKTPTSTPGRIGCRCPDAERRLDDLHLQGR